MKEEVTNNFVPERIDSRSQEPSLLQAPGLMKTFLGLMNITAVSFFHRCLKAKIVVFLRLEHNLWGVILLLLVKILLPYYASLIPCHTEDYASGDAYCDRQLIPNFELRTNYSQSSSFCYKSVKSPNSCTVLIFMHPRPPGRHIGIDS